MASSPISSWSRARPIRRPAPRGVSLIIVEADRDGFTRGRNLEKIGLKAQDTSELFFDNVRVPATNIIGEEGRGFAYMMNELPRERLLVSISAVAVIEASLAWTVEYTRERKAFGKSLAEFQNTRFKLAEVKTEATVARVFLNDCLAKHMRGELDIPTAAMCKWWLTELQGRVVDTCLQLFGGYGYMWEYPIAPRLCRQPDPADLCRHDRDHEGDRGAVAVRTGGAACGPSPYPLPAGGERERNPRFPKTTDVPGPIVGRQGGWVPHTLSPHAGRGQG